MNEIPVVVLFRGLKASSVLHELIARQAMELRDAGMDVRHFRAVVELKEWPSHAPSYQVSLTVGHAGGELTAGTADFGCSTPYLAVANAGRQLRETLSRFPRGSAANDPGPQLATALHTPIAS